MALNKNERDLLAQLQAKADEPPEPEFEVEWWEEDEQGNRRGGRMPWSTARKLYANAWPDLFKASDDDEDTPKDKPEDPKAGGATRLFQGNRKIG